MIYCWARMTFSAAGRGARVLFFFCAFFFFTFSCRGQIPHSYSCIYPVKKGQSAYLVRGGEFRHLGWKGWKVQYWKIGVGGCSLIKTQEFHHDRNNNSLPALISLYVYFIFHIGFPPPVKATLKRESRFLFCTTTLAFALGPVYWKF